MNLKHTMLLLLLLIFAAPANAQSLQVSDRVALSPATQDGRTMSNPLAWINGVVNNSDLVQSCGTSLFGIRTQQFAGYLVQANGSAPAVGELTYGQVVISHPGLPCSGGSFIGIEFLPPPGMQVFITPNTPVICAYHGVNGVSQVSVFFTQAAGCGQIPFQGLEGGFNIWAYNAQGQSQPWPLASGRYLSIMVPFVMTAPQNGGNVFRVRVNPDIGVNVRPARSVITNNDVLFRDGLQGINIPVWLCGIPGTVPTGVCAS
jgi:hypothetical protein